MKNLPGLLKGITSNHSGDFSCLSCSHSYSTRNKLKRHERLSNDQNYCQIQMPNEDKKILKYNHGEKSLKTSAIIYADLYLVVYLKKYIHARIILKNLTQRKKISIRFLVTHCLQIVHLM